MSNIVEQKKEFLKNHCNDESILRAALYDSNPEVQLMAVNYIYNFEFLKEIIADEKIDWYVREVAKSSLIELKEY